MYSRGRYILTVPLYQTRPKYTKVRVVLQEYHLTYRASLPHISYLNTGKAQLYNRGMRYMAGLCRVYRRILTGHNNLTDTCQRVYLTNCPTIPTQ